MQKSTKARTPRRTKQETLRLPTNKSTNNPINKEILGESHKKKPIELLRLTSGPRRLLLMGGVHGDEPEGFGLVERYVKEGLFSELEGLAELHVICRLNPDGCDANTRGNARLIDLNRNMPTKDWNAEAKTERYNPGPEPGSEPETRILMRYIEDFKPHGVISAHSWNPMINYNGPAKAWAAHMAKFNKHIIADDIGYPTPGSLGTWAGWERSIPTLTLEIERDLDLESTWKVHGVALQKALLYAAQTEDLEE